MLSGKAGNSASRSRLIKRIAKLLSSCVVCGRAYVDKHPVLLLRIYSLVEQPGKYIFLQARQLFRNALKNRLIEDVDPAIHQSRYLHASFLRKTADSAVRVDIHSSVTVCVLHPEDSERRHRVVASMKFQEVVEIHFKKRIS